MSTSVPFFRLALSSAAFLFGKGLLPLHAFKSTAQGPVLIQVAETNIGEPGTWPVNPPVVETYSEEAFALLDLPQKYISTGVRGNRASPTWVRAQGTITLPAGKHRILLRARGASRLLVQGAVVLETPFWQPKTFDDGNIGELPMAVQDEYLNLGPRFRFAPPGTREAWCEIDFSGQPVEVVLETRIGDINPKSKSKIPFRPELGETVVAYSLQGSNDWSLLAPETMRLPYTDEGWNAYAALRHQQIEEIDTAARATHRAASSAYWDKRRASAHEWLASAQPVPVPALPAGMPAFNAVDHFIGARIAEAEKEYQPDTSSGTSFFREVQPILERHCYSCHQGNKVKGGLRLDNRADAFLGGNADGTSIVVGKPEESPLFLRVISHDPEEVMPAKGDRLSDRDVAILRSWIEQGAKWPEFHDENYRPTPLADDLTFLRRVTLDTVGVVPTEAEIVAFQADTSPERRNRVIDRLLADRRWADNWMGYWQEVLAENPNLINPTLNNTGPFRWWLYESLIDNKPLDLFVTELLRLEGSERFGGPAGFGVATGNDVPMATKGMIISSAFLGVEMKCARCHDAPTHASKQEELFSLAAMLQTTDIVLPATSSVVMDHLRQGGRKPLIEVTLQPGSKVSPAWPFAEFCDEDTARTLAENPNNSRDLLATLITAPQNERFAQVMANRVWQRLMGRGLVDDVGDWEKSPPTHPELLAWLGREFVRLDYDVKALSRLILTSHAYQRATDPNLLETSRLFVAPAPRALAAEQLVDSLFTATGKPFRIEEVNLDVDSVRTIDNALNLGTATRAWMLGSISNERDRPSLTLPRLAAVAEVLEVFGWRAARPDPSNGVRTPSSNLLQPALLSNGTMIGWLTQLSEDHGLTQLALQKQPLETLIDRVYARFFTRLPTSAERQTYLEFLQPGYENRIRPESPSATVAPAKEPRVRAPFVAWSNHMLSEANTLRMQEQVAAREGDPVTTRLDPDWRRRFEDVIWALLNAPEWTRVS